MYRSDSFMVNRKYQRKLVWTEAEKQRLIDSILRGYPIPLILLAERVHMYGNGKYEILDGLQRLNAIFGFIENQFAVSEEWFDLEQLARAKQLAEQGEFVAADAGARRLSAQSCAAFLDYQLAVTIYPAMDEDTTVEVFGRINSGGKQLSDQERRQAGVAGGFGSLVRKISSELRGDSSAEVLELSKMPEISIDSARAPQKYGLKADDIVWCRQGILRSSDLRDSEDEELVADILASILLDEPFPRSKEALDELYSKGTERWDRINTGLTDELSAKVSADVKMTFSLVRETIEAVNPQPNALRNIVSSSNNPAKSAFYAVFMAFYRLVVDEGRLPQDCRAIVQALGGLQGKLTTSRHYTTTEDRKRNIDLTVGLIQGSFVHREASALRHGPGLTLDFENSLRRSRIETARYEFKQGVLPLEGDRKPQDSLYDRIIRTICAIANVGPEADGFIHIGVADKREDAEKIRQIDQVNFVEIAGHCVVGIDREARQLGESLDDYVRRITDKIRNSQLSEPLRLQVLSQIDVIEFRALSVVRIRIPSQQEVSFVGSLAYAREGSQTIDVADQRKVLAMNRLFEGKERN